MSYTLSFAFLGHEYEEQTGPLSEAAAYDSALELIEERIGEDQLEQLLLADEVQPAIKLTCNECGYTCVPTPKPCCPCTDETYHLSSFHRRAS